ncbi:hypothetical protein MPSEU_000755200 [Mayamaea pseudoterrestris]|nr:hypothetical protein MPSEU_000755200 [Mayamaea pseudoterrestris]
MNSKKSLALSQLLVSLAICNVSAFTVAPATSLVQNLQLSRITRSFSNTLLHATPNTLDGIELPVDATIEPTGNSVWVQVRDTLVATSGGILLPDQSQERPTEGSVVAVGPGKRHPHTGVLITNPISVGQSVVYGQYDGKQVEYNGQDCQVIRDDNVLLTYEGVTMRLEKIVPVRDYVLVELAKEQLTTKSGVVVANQVLKDYAPCQGLVVKVGEGRMAANGQLSKSPVQVGDFVKFKDYAGNDIEIEGKTYSVVKMVDILCTLVEENDENGGATKEEEAAAEA